MFQGRFLKPPALVMLALGALTVCVPGARPAWAQNNKPVPPPPFLSVQSEETTGVYFDSDTLVPQTPILFSARVQNPSAEPRQIELSWKITDANRKVRWEREAKFDVSPNTSILRRELFDPPARGGYLLEVSAVAKQKGPDITSRVTLPFAVTIAPLPNASNVARPQSFFVLSTPALLPAAQLDLYSRLGARVLRSPLPPDPAKPDWRAVENQLNERVRRNLATIALLPLGEGQNRRGEAFWARQVPATLARFGGLSLWELSGDVSPADLDAWAQVARARRPDINLLGPLPSSIPIVPAGASVRLAALNGATFEWPHALETHPASLRRLWLARGAAARGAGINGFHLRRDSDTNPSLSPGDAAGSLVADYLSAIMAGASSMSESLAPQMTDDKGMPMPLSAPMMARGAAFSMLSRTLEDASFREQLYPNSPSLEGALFRAPSGSVGMLYSPMGQGTMTLRVAPAHALDLFGNTLATSQDGRLKLPLSGQPVYISADVTPDVLSYAFKTATLDGIDPLAAQVLPLSRLVGLGGPGSTAVRVRLQNIGIGTRSGQIRLQGPKGWKFARDRYDFNMGEGESRTFEFRALASPANPKAKTNLSVPFAVDVTGQTRMSWKQDAPVGTATLVTAGQAPTIDGDLTDWAGAAWQTVAPNAAGVSAKLAWKWDADAIYVAAQVKEAALQARRSDENPYEFWHGHDGVQFAIGTSNGPETVPSATPFRDSDRGFLLAPFNQRGASEFDGRVLRLWGPEPRIAYNQTVDRVRWGGAVDGARCAITRDEGAERTIYEARIPLSAFGDLNPRSLSQKDAGVRFGWLVHNDEGTALDWGASVGNFPWWDNTSTFLPEGTLTSPLRATLGFSLSPDLARATSTPAIMPETPPVVATPTPTPTPAPIAIPTPVATPVAPILPPTIEPFPIAPTTPRGSLLPPATPRMAPAPASPASPSPAPIAPTMSSPSAVALPPVSPVSQPPAVVAPSPAAATPVVVPKPTPAPVATPAPHLNFPTPTPLTPTGVPESIPPFVIPPSNTPPRQLPPAAP